MAAFAASERHCAKMSCWRLISLFAFLVAVAGCGSEGEATAADTPWVYGERGDEPPPSYDEYSPQRASCNFNAGSHTVDTVGHQAPDLSKLEHVVLLMMENRSFDHYFSTLAHENLRSSDVAHLERNPDGKGSEVSRFPEPRYCVKSPGHEWNDVHLQYGAGRLDGFIAASNPDGERAMGYYSEEQIPFYHYLARTFAISARHFSSLLGPTQPNRLFYFLGTSCNLADEFSVNPKIIWGCGASRPSLFSLLEQAHASYEVYDASGIATLVVALGIRTLPLPKSLDEFISDAAAGHLPAVTVVGASTGQFPAPAGNDDHGPFNPQLGQKLVGQVVKALSGPLWEKSALIITYDEHGGYYDHVPPPPACPPEPESELQRRDYKFDQYGFRVPLIVVSPWARANYVSRFDTDHTSILRFVEHWLNLPALSARDANAWPLLDLFDFAQDPLPPPSWDETWTETTSEAEAQCREAGKTGATGLPE
jgi:phospholipase C